MRGGLPGEGGSVGPSRPLFKCLGDECVTNPILGSGI